MIKIENLGKCFEDRWIFRNLNFTVAPKASASIVGPSGGGKTILLKIISSLISADEGSVTVANPNIGMLFQKNALFDSFTVEENLLFPLKERKGIIGKEAHKRTAHFLNEVGLKGSENQFPDQISGGMQKRLGIARALIVEPEVILYDEPTAGLDPITSKKIADLIRKLRAESGTTLLTVTNDMQRAYQLGDEVYLLAQGRLTPGGTPEQVQASQDPAVRQFIYGLRDGPLTSPVAGGT